MVELHLTRAHLVETGGPLRAVVSSGARADEQGEG